jgi:hypothetical protein
MGSPSNDRWQSLAITALHLAHPLPGGFVHWRNHFKNTCCA